MAAAICGSSWSSLKSTDTKKKSAHDRRRDGLGVEWPGTKDEGGVGDVGAETPQLKRAGDDGGALQQVPADLSNGAGRHRLEEAALHPGVEAAHRRARPDLKIERPVVVAVHGFVIGGGIGICGASDTIFASDDAYFSLPEVDRGAMGGASHLSRMLPLQKVRAAFFTGGKIPAAEAYRLGAVEAVVPRDQLDHTARAFCTTVASKSRKALVIAKEALNGLEPRDVDRGYRWEQGFTLEMYMHADSQRARDAFVETGKAADF